MDELAIASSSMGSTATVVAETNAIADLIEQAGLLCHEVRPMRVRYFADTDTLLIEFQDALVVETRDLDEDTMLDVDANGNICAITIEHASRRTGAPQFSFEHVPA